MRGPDGSGRDGFIVRPTAEGRLAFGCVGPLRMRGACPCLLQHKLG